MQISIVTSRILGCFGVLALISAAVPAMAQSDEKQNQKPGEPVKVEPVQPGKTTVAGPGAPQKHDAGAGMPTPTVVLKPGEKPAIKFDTPVYDFGRKRAGDDIVYAFEFSNTGTGPLELTRVKPSCGCTTAGDFDRIIQPGQKGKIPVKLGTSKMSGPIAKTVIVNTNVEGPDSTITLNIKGELWETIAVAPRTAYFGRVTREEVEKEAKAVNLTVLNNSEKPMKLEKVRSTAEAFTAKLKELEPGKKYELSVTAAKGLKPGLNSANIEMDTGMEDMPTISIPASVFITADVDVTPEQVMIPQGQVQATKRSLYVRNNTKGEIKISDLKVTTDKVKAALEETRPGFTYRITLDIPADYTPAESDKITMKTSSDKVPELTIPIVQQAIMRNPPTSSAKISPIPVKTGSAVPAKAEGGTQAAVATK